MCGFGLFWEIEVLDGVKLPFEGLGIDEWGKFFFFDGIDILEDDWFSLRQSWGKILAELVVSSRF